MQNGYLTMNSVKLLHNKEIDILAMHPKTGHKVHVEVQVSIHPFAPFRAWSHVDYGRDPLPLRIRYFCENKFVGFLDKKTRDLKDRCIEELVKNIFGEGEYERWLIVGVLHKRDPRDKLKEALEENGVKLKTIKEILLDMQSHIEEHIYMDDTRRYIQIFSTFLSCFGGEG